MDGFPELDQPLTDGVVSLRLPAEWDIPDILIAHQDDPGLHLALGMDSPPSGAELGRAVDAAPDLRAAGIRLELTIVRAGSEDCIGQLDVHSVRWEHQRAELGIWVAPHARGEGVARRVLGLAGDWLLGSGILERLALLTEPDNEAMLRSARAAGFKDEGVLRSYGNEHGRRIDLALLSLLRSDLSAS